MAQPQTNPQTILSPLNIPQQAKADLWELANSSKNEAELATKLQQPQYVNLPNQTKADLWEWKKSNSAAAAKPDPRIGTATASPSGIGPWLQSLENDVRTGSTSTLPGRVLHALGARGTDTGVTGTNPIVQTVTGPIHAAQGQVQQYQGGKEGNYSKQAGGALKTLGGILDTANIPLAFVGNSPGTAEAVMGKTIPSVAKEQAAQKFSEVMSAVGNRPVDIGEAGNVALKAQELASRGGTMPKVIRDFVRRATDPEQGPMSYAEARDFYSNATRLSADEFQRLTPVMRAKVSEFTAALGRGISGTAEAGGQGDKLASAMSQYRFGAQGQKAVNSAIKYGGSALMGDLLARALMGRFMRTGN